MSHFFVLSKAVFVITWLCWKCLKTMDEEIRKFLQRTIFVRDIKCIFCGAELSKDSKYCTCDACLAKLPFITCKVCKKCGEPIESLAEFCMQCKNHVDRGFDKARAVFLYREQIKQAIAKFKFYGNRYLGEYLSYFLLDLYINENWNCDVVIPAPISQKGLKARGYNQTDLLCHAFVKFGIPFDNTSIVKHLETQHQVGLGYKDRQTNLIGAFKVVNKQAIKDKKILLVDDIYTTGATVSEISETLKKAGASEVNVITLCHEMPENRKN